MADKKKMPPRPKAKPRTAKMEMKSIMATTKPSRDLEADYAKRPTIMPRPKPRPAMSKRPKANPYR